MITINTPTKELNEVGKLHATKGIYFEVDNKELVSEMEDFIKNELPNKLNQVLVITNLYSHLESFIPDFFELNQHINDTPLNRIKFLERSYVVSYILLKNHHYVADLDIYASGICAKKYLKSLMNNGGFAKSSDLIEFQSYAGIIGEVVQSPRYWTEEQEFEFTGRCTQYSFNKELIIALVKDSKHEIKEFHPTKSVIKIISKMDDLTKWKLFINSKMSFPEEVVNEAHKIVDKGYFNDKGEVRDRYHDSLAILELQNGNMGALIPHYDSYSGRCHNIMTRLRRDTRKKLLLDGEPVVELDVHACILVILAALIGNKKLIKYLENTEDFYGDVMEVAELIDEKYDKSNPIHKEIRRNLKTRFLKYLNSVYSDDRAFIKFFNEIDPNITLSINLVRMVYNNKNAIPKMTQIIEAQLILEELPRKLLNKGILFETIHDCIVVQESKVDIAKQLMLETFKERLGINVKVT